MGSKAEHLASEFLDIDLLGSLPSLEVQARYLVSGFLNGLHRSPYRGSSVEFKEYRDYQPGDPIKLIDWKVYGRTDRLHLRLRDDETNMNVYILLDYSASMGYRGPKSNMSKWEYARSLAAALMLFLSRQGDSFTLSLVGEELEDYIKPGSKQAHFVRLLSKLHRDPVAKACSWRNALDSLTGLIRKRSIVVLISDFYTDLDEFAEELNRLRFLKCEPLFFNIYDPMEINFDFDEPMLMGEMETGSRMRLSPDLIQKTYRERMQQHIKDLSDLVMSYGGDYMMLQTDTPPLKALGKYLSVRSERFK